MQNQMELTFSALPQNEAFARVAIAAFAVQLNPTLPEMADIKTAVSEAVTNAIVHGYRGREDGLVRMSAEYGDRRLLTVVIRRRGLRHRGCGKGHAALLFHRRRCGAQRHGLLRDADLHGRGRGGQRRGQGDDRHHAQIHHRRGRVAP